MVIGSTIVAVALLILGWTGEIVAFFLGDGDAVCCQFAENIIAIMLTVIRLIQLL